ncbi:hypothetical protein OUZ56_012709 [Daphnia magna]|uniref:Uncharacterized protein n=1 Tax=Daphnia magna TaxID=35525 RepID=A0ABQ9Z3U6_9CRUS|nr:hypothetical protein OUZ56_012709 [Daphnia magna]
MWKSKLMKYKVITSQCIHIENQNIPFCLHEEKYKLIISQCIHIENRGITPQNRPARLLTRLQDADAEKSPRPRIDKNSYRG